MKVRVNKKWWQFWLPSELEGHISDSVHDAVNLTTPNATDAIINAAVNNSRLFDGPSAIEADEDIPWYGQEGEESNVVTAEPPIVSASRGNAKVAERKERAKMQ